MIELQLLLLIIIANGAALLSEPLLKKHWDHPVDGGLLLSDGQPLFGHHTTWRGIALASIATPMAAWLVGLPLWTGLVIALLAMSGDMLSSFIKRRLQREPGRMALGLDQIPEALLPLLGVYPAYGLTLIDLLWIPLAFLVFELLISRLLFRLHLRRRPY
jgi:CDP-2,3-bis-(O-geranylgeranyl)-sn-glycerol synthase